METRSFETPLGDVLLWGEPQAFEDDRPVVLAISGAFAPKESFDLLYLAFPEAAVLVAHLPGNHSPPLVATSVGAFAAAFSHVVSQLGRPTVVCGSSVAGVVAMGMRAPEIRGIAALDPPFRTAKLWRLVNRLQEGVRRGAPANEVEFCREILGVTATAIEDRNYLPLLDGLATPTWCVFGETPLMPPRELDRDPSLVDEPERQILRRHPAVKTMLVKGVGHNLPKEGAAAIVDVIGRLLAPILAGEPAPSPAAAPELARRG
jgi:hypothetical protein